jgi:UDP-N-acetylglucosamine--N-acetylmuramyl-(pentapeptide) pyrophosphoryl-undecaprenol N-acetylglucosamine transferase
MISGGGTGGHIYPAIAIANAWMEKHPNSELLFVGAEGKMEMQKVPEAGYAIVGLKVAGLKRALTLDNLSFPFKLMASLKLSRKLIKNFDPHAVVGVGGYASGPLLYIAQRQGIPTLIQEQNSYAGLTNKLLAKRADAICVAYPRMEEFFSKEKIKYTGNPVRKDILSLDGKVEQAFLHFGLERSKPVILVLGGSLGAKTINEAILYHMEEMEALGYQVLWQAGKFYYEDMKSKLAATGLKHIHVLEFIKNMDLAYAAADLVVSRAGALSVSELSLAGKAVIFIPSPNVVDDHQTKNAMALVKSNAAAILNDSDAVGGLLPVVEELMQDPATRVRFAEAIKKLSKPNAAKEIVGVLENMIK